MLTLEPTSIPLEVEPCPLTYRSILLTASGLAVPIWTATVPETAVPEAGLVMARALLPMSGVVQAGRRRRRSSQSLCFIISLKSGEQ